MVKTYNPKEVILTVGPYIISGYADGSFITVERNEDAWSLQIGTDGEGTRSKSNNRSGTVTTRLMQSSDSNQVLSALALADEQSGAGIVPIFIKDGSPGGTTLVIAESGWVRKLPSVEYDRTALGREWVLETDVLTINVGGN